MYDLATAAEESLYSLNNTELYQMCRSSGLTVHPGACKEALVHAVLNHVNIDNNPIDELRDQLILFIEEHWRVLQAQLKCPAKYLRCPDPEKENRRPCYGCLDMQVVACVADLSPANKHRLTQLRRTT